MCAVLLTYTISNAHVAAVRGSNNININMNMNVSVNVNVNININTFQRKI